MTMRFNQKGLDADDLAIERELVETDKPKLIACATGKVGWKKQSKAANAAKSMRKFKADPFLEVYRCPKCGQWHIGHAPGTRIRQEQFNRSAAVAREAAP
jgi:hypothetical protein